MKKKGILIIITIFLLTSCKQKSLDNKDYVRLKDINPKVVPEIKLEFELLGNPLIIKEISSGYICATHKEYEEPDKEVEKVGYSYWLPIIRKLDEDYKIVWEKEFDQKGQIDHLYVLDDDSFLFSVKSMEYMNIIKCDDKGKQLWVKEFDSSIPYNTPEVLLTDSKEILVIELWIEREYGKKYRNGQQVIEGYGVGDIFITKLDQKGKKICQKEFGGTGYDIFNIAKYHKDIGIIVKGCSSSIDGSFAKMGQERNDYIACIDENNLEVKWFYNYDEDSFNDETLIEIDDDNKKKIIESLKCPQDKIFPTQDGGFIEKSIRNITELPLSIFSSNVKYDTEVVIEKYDSNHEVQWRKTYDKYKNSKYVDCVIPLRDGRIIVEAQ